MSHGLPPRVFSPGLLFALAAAFFSGRVGAQGAGASVQVDCPQLGEEPRAALEARAKAELLVRREKGTLLVSCRHEAANVRWTPDSGDAVEHDIPLAADAIATEEQILEALELLLRPRQAPAAAPSPRAATEAPAAPSKPLQTRPTKPPPPRPPPPPPAPALAPPESQPAATAATEPPYFELLVGPALELWSSEVTGAIGPRVRMLVTFPGGWAVSGGATVAWTLRASEGVTGRVIRPHVSGEYHFGQLRRWRLGAGLLLDLLHATRDAAAATETENEAIIGGFLQAHYAFLGLPVELLLGPTVSARAAAVRVQVGDREIFSIPAVAFGATAELGLGPL